MNLTVDDIIGNKNISDAMIQLFSNSDYAHKYADFVESNNTDPNNKYAKPLVFQYTGRPRVHLYFLDKCFRNSLMRLTEGTTIGITPEDGRVLTDFEAGLVPFDTLARWNYLSPYIVANPPQKPMIFFIANCSQTPRQPGCVNYVTVESK